MKNFVACGALLLAVLVSGRAHAENVILFESTTLSADVTKAAGDPKAFRVPPDLDFTVVMEVDKATFAALEKDPLLHAQAHEAVQGVYQDLVKEDDVFGMRATAH